jgi:hypothetical protein
MRSMLPDSRLQTVRNHSWFLLCVLWYEVLQTLIRLLLAESLWLTGHPTVCSLVLSESSWTTQITASNEKMDGRADPNG